MADKEMRVERISSSGQLVVEAHGSDRRELNPAAKSQEQTDAKAILQRVRSLTSIVRTGWITVVLGCLYAWLTLASFNDADLFLPDRTLTLPIIQTEITANGFFVFGPLILLAAFFYFHLMQVRLWESYGQLRALSKPQHGLIDGIPVDERVEPWFMTILIPQERRDFDLASKWVGRVLCFYFLPVTVFAIGYRYLRAHDYLVTGLHCVLIATAFVSAYLFSRYQQEVVATASRRRRSRPLMVSLYLVATVCLFLGANWLSSHKWFSHSLLQKVSPHAQLFRAKLSRVPPGWDELSWLELRNEIRNVDDCARSPLSISCNGQPSGSERSPLDMDSSPPPTPDHQTRLRELKGIRETRLATIAGAELGHVPAPGVVGQNQSSAYGTAVSREGAVIEYDCRDWPVRLALPARNLNFADLRQAFLVGANLRCTTLRNADLRLADLTGANLENADLTGADLSQANLSGAKLYWAKLNDTVLKPYFEYNQDLRGTDLTGANLENANLSSLLMRDLRLHGTILSNTDIEDTDFSNSEFQGAIINKTYFSSSLSIAGANLNGAALRETFFSTKNIFPGEALGAPGVSAQVFSDQVKHAFGDASVQLPDGIAQPTHWLAKDVAEDRFFGLWQGWRVACGLAPQASAAQERWLADREYTLIPWPYGRAENCPPVTK